MKRIFGKLFGSNESRIKKLQPLVNEIGQLEPEMKKLTDEQILEKTQSFKEKIKDGESIENFLPEAFALVREVTFRLHGIRLHDSQMFGGIALHQGKIAEMKTGEGKTHASLLPGYLNGLTGKGVHIVTVNDYLARRDCNWMGAIYNKLGLTTSCITNQGGFMYEANNVDKNEVDIEEENLIAVDKKEAYNADITYGTNNEFGFDYLRDNMAPSIDVMVQRKQYYAIVDEVDSILIDEARTPLIISAPDEESGDLYKRFAGLVRNLKEEEHYTVDLKEKTVALTDEGISEIERLLDISNIYDEGKDQYVHHLEQSLKAQVIFEKDKDYMVKGGQVLIVDEFTGRAMDGRRYSDGLHQALEAKEGVTIQRESRTLATITFQNYFRMYEKIAGMTGTASTSAEEFEKVYKLDVLEIPTNKPVIREDLPDVVYKTEKGKFKAITQKIEQLHKKGQPILLGTVAIETSEALSKALEQRKISHSVLNAKFHEKEAEIIANAGKKGAVTIATNMAGRGTDIKLGEGVNELGGLYVIGTERHDARRIDNQLRGRSGRQGDNGTTQFYISLDDELFKRFGGDKLVNVMNRLGLPEDQPIQNKIISKQIENAQSKIEGFNFDMRKHVLEYDDVINKQREAIYKRRREVLESDDVSGEILEMLRQQAQEITSRHAVAGQYHWNTDELVSEIKEIFPVDDKIKIKIEDIIKNPKSGEKETVGTIIDFIFGEAKIAYNKKETELGESQMRQIEKAVLLENIDKNWMNHIDSIDHLRKGIGLRGYAQRDPLIEFKKESFELFAGLMNVIRHKTLSTIFKIEGMYSNVMNEVNTASEDLLFGNNDLEFSVEDDDSSKQENKDFQKPVSSSKTVGRNDKCPCGSDKKYKRCCGKLK